MSQPLIEYLEESRLYAMNFKDNLSLLAPGETITAIVGSVTATPSTGITVSDQSIELAGKRILFRISPTVSGAREIYAKVTTSDDNTLVGVGTLLVK